MTGEKPHKDSDQDPDLDQDQDQDTSPLFDPDIRAYYEKFSEDDRLTTGTGLLEFARTQDILTRHLPPPPAVVLDVGAGTGPYACWLAREGYQTHLVEPVPRLVEQARERAAWQPEHPLASCRVGDARALDHSGECADVVLLFGPLYHLTEQAERQQALREAYRVLKSGGLLFAAAISRYASVLDGLAHGYLDDPEFAAIVGRDLEDGQHRNPTDILAYFTTAYFHQPAELREEIVAAGFTHEMTLAVEGPVWLLDDFTQRWTDPGQRAAMLDLARELEAEEALWGASPHLLAVAVKA